MALACLCRFLPSRGCLYRLNVRIDLDGNRWEPVRGATAPAREFIAARSLIDQIHQQARWDPWVLQDRASEYDAAPHNCGQWASTDPAPPGKTDEEYEAELDQRLAEADARFEARQAQAGKDRAGRARHYDPDRDRARLALLEVQAILAGKIRQREQILSGEAFRLADEGGRRRLVAGLEYDIAAGTREADDLAAVVGDPQTVSDAGGWLPAERRELALTLFKARRLAQVRDLRARIAEAQATSKSGQGKPERAALRAA
jgi:hypothetical protein